MKEKEKQRLSKVHYTVEEKMDIMRLHLEGTDDIEHPEYSGKYDLITRDIAGLISSLTFRDLADLARALKVISQGKVG